MLVSAKTYDVHDLADPASSFRSRFRNIPFDLIVDSLSHDLGRDAAAKIKKFLIDKDCRVKGPVAEKFGVKEFKFDRVAVAAVENAIVYRSVIQVKHSTYLAIDSLSKLSLPETVNVQISVLEDSLYDS